MTGGEASAAAALAPRMRSELEELVRREGLLYADKKLLRDGRLEELLTGIRDRHRSDVRLLWIMMPLYVFALIDTASVALVPASEGASGTPWKWMATGACVGWLAILVGMTFLIRYFRADVRRTEALLAELAAAR